MRIPGSTVFSNRIVYISVLSGLFILISSFLHGQTSWSNTDTINIQDGTTVPIPGKPYPSEIIVADQKGGLVARVKVTLHQLHHNFPDGMDLLLVAPDQSNVILLSDVGGAPDINGVDISLDDEAPAYLPDRTVLLSGNYKPTNMGTDIDVWPPTAPAASGADVLSTFNGIDPNGKWSLYAVSDMDGTFGMIAGGWTLTLELVKASKPVDFEKFTATYDASINDVLLNWETAYEYNTKTFVIERASQGSGWAQLAQINAAGFTTTASSYEYTDTGVTQGWYMYRVKMIAKDGSVRYSELRTIIAKTTSYYVYPNPARNFTYIVSDSRVAENVTVILTDINNNILTQKVGTVSIFSPMRFDFTTQRSGPHYLVIHTAKGKTVKTINVIRQ